MIYIAGPMFSQAELMFNELLASKLEGAGLKIFLPQRDGGNLKEMLKTMTVKEAHTEIFRMDTEMVSKAEAFLFVLDGHIPDEGACVALGFASAKGVPCYGLKTDPRTAMNGEMNPMLTGSIKKVFKGIDEVVAFFMKK